MRIGIYDPYLDTLGGGEKYMLYIAKLLADKNETIFFWDDKTIFEKAESKFGIDLSKVVIEKNIFSKKTPIYKRLIESRKFDVIIADPPYYNADQVDYKTLSRYLRESGLLVISHPPDVTPDVSLKRIDHREYAGGNISFYKQN